MGDIPIISSTSIDENTGIARIIIEGNITVPHECDNPVIELFRPIRAIYVKEMFFTINLTNSVVESYKSLSL